MAKSSKKNLPKPLKKKKEILPKFTRSCLVAVPADDEKTADIQVEFTSGIGQVTAALFRNGVLINMQSISKSGAIHFSDVQSRDSVSVNGICSGNASVTLTVPSDPATPEFFSKQVIMTGYTIL